MTREQAPRAKLQLAREQSGGKWWKKFLLGLPSHLLPPNSKQESFSTQTVAFITLLSLKFAATLQQQQQSASQQAGFICLPVASRASVFCYRESALILGLRLQTIMAAEL